jgi:osmoprotectant transport system permease protein
MSEKRAERLGVRRISDRRATPSCARLQQRVPEAQDGWDGLRSHYGLPQRVVGMEHELAYRSLDGGGIDVTELYSTDANIRFYGLRVLEDDRHYFPTIRPSCSPGPTWKPASRTSSRHCCDWRAHRRRGHDGANAEVTLKREPESRVAVDFLKSRLGIQAEVREEGLASRLLRRTAEHLELVGISLALAVLAAVPLGVVAAKYPKLGQVILGVVGVIQTIPSLAVLVFMIRC